MTKTAHSEFSLLPWWEPQWMALAARRREKTLPHAILLSGAAGIGKTHFAQALAHAMLCRSPHPDGQPCGRCSDCLLFAAGNHPDYQWMTFEINPNTGKLRTEIVVDQIRALGTGLALKSHQGGTKVAVIDPAGSMNVNAANSLLKTLEEPSDNTLLILVCASTARLPATIHSRCQRLVLDLPEPAQARHWLEKQGLKTPELLLPLAGGAPLAALALAEGDALQRRKTCFEGFQAVWQGTEDPVKLAEQWAKLGRLEILDWLTHWCMDMVRLQHTPQHADLRNPDLHQALGAMAEALAPQTLYDLLDRCWEARLLATTATSQQLTLEDFLIRWARSRPVAPAARTRRDTRTKAI